MLSGSGSVEGFVPETFFPPPGKLEIVNKRRKMYLLEDLLGMRGFPERTPGSSRCWGTFANGNMCTGSSRPCPPDTFIVQGWGVSSEKLILIRHLSCRLPYTHCSFGTCTCHQDSFSPSAWKDDEHNDLDEIFFVNIKQSSIIFLTVFSAWRKPCSPRRRKRRSVSRWIGLHKSRTGVSCSPWTPSHRTRLWKRGECLFLALRTCRRWSTE